MKQLLLLVSLFVSVSTLKAQSAEETLEWLNAKKIEMKFTKSNVGYLDNIEITAEHLKIYNSNGGYATAAWPRVKEIRKGNDNYEIMIVCDWSYQDKPGFIALNVYNIELRDKIIKALKHMATLKGAKMIDSDLF